MASCVATCKEWDVFLGETEHARRGEPINTMALSLATGHVEECAACMARWNDFINTIAPQPVPASKPGCTAASMMRLAVKATGFSPEMVSLKTPLGPLQAANFLILLIKYHGRRHLEARYCFPGQMTVGSLIKFWEGSPQRL